jgi:hypothetical protein
VPDFFSTSATPDERNGVQGRARKTNIFDEKNPSPIRMHVHIPPARIGLSLATCANALEKGRNLPPFFPFLLPAAEAPDLIMSAGAI